MNKIILITFAVSALFATVDCHGRMKDPVNRMSAWRTNKQFPVVREEGEWCAVLDRVTMEPIPNFRGVECGVAGPIYGGSIHGGVSFYQPQHERNATGYSVEYGSEKYLGQVVKTYKKGETISVVLFIPANHRGFVEFRLCEAPENADPTKECFENNKLKFENGQDRADVMSGQINGNDFTYKVQLPEEKTCEHCVFQWYWYGALTSQLYINAADISIIV